MPVGSELEWRILLFGWNPPVTPGLGELLARNYLSYLATWDEPVSFEDLRFDLLSFENLSRMSPIYDATDPDLRPFRDAGGKLILWHGWNDANISPLGTIAYYQAVQDAAGGLDQAQQFARLYMFPGVAHCGGPTSQFDLLTPLVAWVEQGTAPTAVIVTQAQAGEAEEAQSAAAGSAAPQPVICQAQEGRTRPVYPYPRVARYDGLGSIDDAANFAPAGPPIRYDDHIAWAGQYQSGYQQWCAWQAMELVCQSDQPEN
jgi:feruloyl esterase